MKTKLYWHIHHDVLCEFSDNIAERIEYIKLRKPADEQDTRLSRLRQVKRVPVRLTKAWLVLCQAQDNCNNAWTAYKKEGADYMLYEQADRACDQAQRICDKTRIAYDQVWDAYKQVLESCKAKLEALHKKQCPNCPWNGETIFPGRIEI